MGISTITTVTSYSNPATVGFPVTFLAIVSFPDGGTVSFFDGATELATVELHTANSVTYATYSDSSLSIGGHTITATYNGDSTYDSSSGTIAQTVTSSGDTIVLPGFAFRGIYLTTGDEGLTPSASAAAIPSVMASYTPVYIVWNTVNIVLVRITGSNGVDAPVDSGFITVMGSGSGFYEIPTGLQQSMVLTFNAYDTPSHIADTINIPLTITFSPIVISDGFGDQFGDEFTS